MRKTRERERETRWRGGLAFIGDARAGVSLGWGPVRLMKAKKLLLLLLLLFYFIENIYLKKKPEKMAERWGRGTGTDTSDRR